MGYKFKKKKKENKNFCFGKRSLVKQDDGWKFILGLGKCEGVGE